jgi:hypothetical protein
MISHVRLRNNPSKVSITRNVVSCSLGELWVVVRELESGCISMSSSPALARELESMLESGPSRLMNVREVLRAIMVANMVKIASAMLPRPIAREIVSLVETKYCQSCLES